MPGIYLRKYSTHILLFFRLKLPGASLLCLLSTGFFFGQAPVRFGQHQNYVIPDYAILSDSGHTPPEDILNNRRKFTPTNGNVPSYFVSHLYHWIRFDLVNESKERLVLELRNIGLEKLKVYVKTSDSLYTFPELNWSVSPEKRQLKTWRNAVPLDIPGHKAATIYMQAYKHYGTIELPVVIWSEAEFFKSEREHDNKVTFFTGVASVLCLICLLIYFNTRQIRYLYYLLYVVFILIWRAYIEGYLLDWMQHTLNRFANPVYGNIVLGTALTFGILFIKHFLLNPAKSPKWHFYLVNTCIAYCIALQIVFVAIGIETISYRWFGNLYLLALVLCSLISTVSIVSGISRKESAAYVYLISWLPMLTNLFFIFCNNSGLMYVSDKYYISMYNVLLFEILVLSLGLAFDFRNFIIERKNREIEALKALQKEKQQISRDLHDNVGGQLSYMLYSLNDIEHGAQEKRRLLAANFERSIRQVISNLRETIWAIKEENIPVSDFSDKLKVYTRTMFAGTGVNITFSEQIEQETVLKNNLGLELYRICQEIVNNAFKHAHAGSLEVKIKAGDTVLVEIRDNGVGFTHAPEQIHGETYGLSNIFKRASESGFEISLHTEPGQGTAYRIAVNRQ